MYIQFLETKKRTRSVHTSGIIFDSFSSEDVFKPISYIQSNTQNPNPISKITIYFTKNTKYVRIN